MTSRFVFFLAGALALGAGTAYATPDDPAASGGKRVNAIAARMARGESYDQAVQATLKASGEEMRPQAIAAGMATGKSYDQAASAVRSSTSEDLRIANARWTKHLAAMEAGGTHEAGWAASTRN